MSEELKALNKIQHGFGQLKGQELLNCYKLIFNGLKRLESIDNTKSSRALECLEALGGVEISHAETEQDEDFNGEWVFDTVTVDDGPIEYLYCEYFNTIKNYILKAQEREKVLNIIKEKYIDMLELECSSTVEQYNESIESKMNFVERYTPVKTDDYKLTKEEFDLLKRYFN